MNNFSNYCESSTDLSIDIVAIKDPISFKESSSKQESVDLDYLELLKISRKEMENASNITDNSKNVIIKLLDEKIREINYLRLF